MSLEWFGRSSEQGASGDAWCVSRAGLETSWSAGISEPLTGEEGKAQIGLDALTSVR